MDAKGTTRKQAGVLHDVARQAAFAAKKVAVESAVERFDKERATEPTSLPMSVHRLECLIDILAFDMSAAREAFYEAMNDAWEARKATRRVFSIKT